MLNLTDILRAKLDRYVENQSILPLDELFGEFTLDTLYELGFEYHKDFMNNEAEYNVSEECILSSWKKNYEKTENNVSRYVLS